jgi:hypothetical protein
MAWRSRRAVEAAVKEVEVDEIEGQNTANENKAISVTEVPMSIRLIERKDWALLRDTRDKAGQPFCLH